ncbi:MAG TPA: oligopeptide/dipeptide ABC transporter ATP-binding protein [Ktedonobacterales bacterium]
MATPAPTFSGSTSTDTILQLQDLVMHFPITQGIIFRRQVGVVHAVDGVSLSVPRGKTTSLVGESGSGKSTIGRCIVRLYKMTSGHIFLDGQDLASARGRELRAVRRQVQMIFQDPFASLDPRMSVSSLIAEPMLIHRVGTRKEIRNRTQELLSTVGLNPRFIDRYPHEFSGGQRQRIAIARAIAIEPKFIVADEPVSALDVSIRAQILNLLTDLQQRMGLTYLFITHDLSVARHIAQRTAVMYLGKLMELADGDDVYLEPLHPYTVALLSAVPIADPKVERRRKRIILTGDLPSPVNIPSGCRFHTRCPLVQNICRQQEPPLEDKTGRGHLAACHFSDRVPALVATGSVQGLGTL